MSNEDWKNPNPSMARDGAAAFPHPVYVGAYHNGMSLRDWFAGQAACGLARLAMKRGWDAYELAETSYDLADAMLAARQEQS